MPALLFTIVRGCNISNTIATISEMKIHKENKVCIIEMLKEYKICCK